jgi:uncharacterized membrane protein YfcA
LSALLAVDPATAWIMVAACMLAGVVRGFAGFGLSAVAMACLAPFVPPVELIATFWWIEMAASLLLMRGGWADADRRLAITLTVAATVSFPLGLLMTLAIPVETSRAIALTTIVLLAAAQLARLRLPGLATPTGTVGAGLVSGLVTGVAGVGGLIIALYTLARTLPARVMRGSLNIFLLGSGITALAVHVALGTMDATATSRGLTLVIPTLAGVLLGQALFAPRWERYYKPACLTLLIALAAAGLARTL